jgi:ADP-heptose:LPS heptosyltransferase
MVHKNLSLLKPLGISVEAIVFPLPVIPEAERRAEALLQAQGVTPHDRVVVLLPATRRRAKQWPPTYYRQLAERLAKERGVYVLLVGAPSEDDLLQRIARGLDGHRILTGVPPLPDLAALLPRTHLAVGNDTGPLHLAAALGVPTIGLYGPTRSEQNGPYGPRIRAIQSPTQAMEDIWVDTVFQSAIEWLA